MAQSSTLIPTFLGGVSQQAHALRRRNLVDAATNIEFLANEGAIKRYPTEHIASLGADLTGYRVIPLERDDQEYLCLFGDADVRVFTVDGTECTITDTAGDSYAYLSGLTQRGLRAQRIADSIWVLNRDVVTAGASGRGFATWEEPGEAGLFIRAVNYSVTYTLTYEDDGTDDATVEYTVPGPVSVQQSNFDVLNITLDQAAGNTPITWTGNPFNSVDDIDVRNVTTATNIPSANYEVYRSGAPDFEYGITVTNPALFTAGDDLRITRRALTLDWYLDTSFILETLLYYLDQSTSAAVDFERNEEDSSARVFNTVREITRFEIDDTESGDLGSAWIRTVDEITDLPVTFKHGAVVEIAGDRSDRRDNYWAVFAGDTWANEGSDPANFDAFDDFESGVWIETQERGLATGAYDVTTMPHILQRTGATTFTWDTVDWTERPVGDEVTNKEPSFIGFPIQSIFFHQGRLGTLSNNSIILSEAGELENFWRSTVLSVPPSDRIDAELADLDGDTLYHAVPFDRTLLVFSRQRQALVFGQPALAPDNIQAPLLTSYRCFPDVSPALVGQSLFFGYSTSQFAQIREFIPGSENNRIFDETITLAAPKYIPSDVRRIVAGSVGETLAVLTDSDPTKVYVYSFLRLGGNLVQAAWSDWDMEDDIIDITFLDDRLILLVDRGGTTFLEQIQLGAGRTETGEDFVPRLDRQTSILSSTYDAPNGRTEITCPYTPSSDIKVLLGATNDLAYGVELDVDSIDGTTIRINGDYTGSSFVVGEPYTASMTLTRPYLQAAIDGAAIAVPKAMQTVRNLNLMLDDTGYLKATTSYVASDDGVNEFLAERMGAVAIDTETLRTGEFNVPVHAGVEDFRVVLSSDSALPFNIISGSWDIRFRPQNLR